MDEGTYFSLNGVGARLWELCDGQSTLQEMVAKIADEFDAPADVIEGDACELIGELLQSKLVEERAFA